MNIAVVGLWHLGCSVAAAWTRLGAAVRGIDFSPDIVSGLESGRPPIFEPELAETLRGGLAQGGLRFSTDPRSVQGCPFVFIAFDTPVRDDDTSDLSPIWDAVERCAPHLDRGAIVIVSAQLPVGTARRIRARLRQVNASVELVYSPENLRLGEAIACYLHPGHIVIGADADLAGRAVEALFAPMQARCFRMNLPSAELVKHCINSFLATSITLANQWSDIAGAIGADYGDVAAVLRADPRIGQRAYVTPGIGFSGGTLGRDLQVLEDVNHRVLEGRAPLFGDVWRYNQERREVVTRRAAELLGGLGERRVALFGMTYKPGTSTLRRSLPLAVATDLLARGTRVRAHDPRADWREVPLPAGLEVSQSPYEAADQADLAVLLTEWPEYRDLDFAKLARAMRTPRMLDTKEFLRGQRAAVERAGVTLVPLVAAVELGDA